MIANNVFRKGFIMDTAMIIVKRMQKAARLFVWVILTLMVFTLHAAATDNDANDVVVHTDGTVSAVPLPEARAWALGCSAVLMERNHDRHDMLLPCVKSPAAVAGWKESLDRWWGVRSSADLMDSLKWIEEEGHRTRFQQYGKFLQSLSNEEYQDLLMRASANKDALGEMMTAKIYYPLLGDKSLLGWDYSRYICLCRWGCLVGYITEEQAWAKIMPVARMLQRTFDSWEDLGRNYLIGRRFWSQEYTEQSGDEYRDAFDRLMDMRSSPWNKYAWDMDLTSNQ